MARFSQHPYLTVTFWRDPKNHYWENDLYTERGKEHLRGFVSDRMQNEKSMAALETPIKNRSLI